MTQISAFHAAQIFDGTMWHEKVDHVVAEGRVFEPIPTPKAPGGQGGILCHHDGAGADIALIDGLRCVIRSRGHLQPDARVDVFALSPDIIAFGARIGGATVGDLP